MKNKAVLSALVIVGIISGVFSIVATKQTVLAQQTTTTNFLPYENPTYGIKAQYPSSWDKQENGTKQDTETDIVTFRPSSYLQR